MLDYVVSLLIYVEYWMQINASVCISLGQVSGKYDEPSMHIQNLTFKNKSKPFKKLTTPLSWWGFVIWKTGNSRVSLGQRIDVNI